MADKEVQITEVLDIALESGKIILQNGGETYRTEETMMSIATSLGAASASAFVTPTVAMLTCISKEGCSHTKMQRITTRTIHLGKIARVNEISRRLQNPKYSISLGCVHSLLQRIDRAPLHHPFFIVLATALASACFSVLFSGTISEIIIAFCIGAIMRTILFVSTPLLLSSFISTALAGSVISVLSGIAVSLGLVSFAANINISVLMTLVPGLVIVNAIRDIIAGDLVAGSARLLEACVIAAALSLGAAVGLHLFPVDPRYIAPVITIAAKLPAFFVSFFAAAFFAYFFYISRYDILLASVFGGLGWLVFIIVGNNSFSSSLPYLAGALCVGLCSEISAVIFKKPATVYIAPGIIPFVPGGGVYETMMHAMLGNVEAATNTGFQTLTAAAAIAVGIALASSIARLGTRFSLRTNRFARFFG